MHSRKVLVADLVLGLFTPCKSANVPHSTLFSAQVPYVAPGTWGDQ